MSGIFANGKKIVYKNSPAVLQTIDPCYIKNGSIKNFPNTAYSKDAINVATKVFIDGNPVCTQQSKFSTTYGSEAAQSGVNSGTLLEYCAFQTSSMDVLINGVGVLRDGDLGTANAGNTAPAAISFLSASSKNLNKIKEVTSDINVEDKYFIKIDFLS